jgi:hypothetical protein
MVKNWYLDCEYALGKNICSDYITHEIMSSWSSFNDGSNSKSIQVLKLLHN